MGKNADTRLFPNPWNERPFNRINILHARSEGLKDAMKLHTSQSVEFFFILLYCYGVFE